MVNPHGPLLLSDFYWLCLEGRDLGVVVYEMGQNSVANRNRSHMLCESMVLVICLHVDSSLVVS